MNVPFLRRPTLGLAILLAGSLILTVVAPGSELLIGIAALGVAAAAWSVTVKNRWYAALAGVFVWSLVGLYLRGVGEPFGAILSLIALVLPVTLLAFWQLEASDTHTTLLGLAAGISTLELFLVLLFWPINFPSRALLVTIAYGLTIELVDLGRHRTLSVRSFMPSLGLSALLTYVIVATADWFGF